MSFLGKIVVVLNFVLAIAFMAFAICVYGMHRNWKWELEGKDGNGGKKAELTKTLEEKKKITDEKEVVEKRLNQVKAENRQALARLESAKAQKEKELDETKKLYTDLLAKNRTAQEQLDLAVADRGKLETENKQLRSELPKILGKRDEVYNSVVAITEQFNKAQGEVSRLQERNDQLAVDLAAAKLLLSKLGTPLGTPPDLQPPVVDGEVTNVSGDTLVEVSLGSDDGIRPGHGIVIFRENKFLARAEIIRTTPNRAVAKIDEKTRTAPVQQGDRMTTKVKG